MHGATFLITLVLYACLWRGCDLSDAEILPIHGSHIGILHLIPACYTGEWAGMTGGGPAAKCCEAIEKADIRDTLKSSTVSHVIIKPVLRYLRRVAC